LYPGNEVRLRAAYVVKCTGVVKDEAGNVIEVHATYDPATRGGDTPDGRKIKSTLHWVSAAHAIPVEVRLYDRLFNRPDPEAGEEGFLGCLNPNSLTVLEGCQVERSLANAQPGDRFQFERQGYFCADTESTPDHLIFNLAVALKDTWAKIEQKHK
jgi:glutaminyl-tRNA synthetase